MNAQLQEQTRKESTTEKNMDRKSATEPEKRPNSYNSQKAMQQYAVAILQKLPMIDRVQNAEEMNDAIYEMLSLLGKCSGADRVYLFDRDQEKDTYNKKYEWCAPGIPAQHDFLESVTGNQAPEWRKAFNKGEILVIPDVEAVKETMPLEYAFLKKSGVHSEIVVPVYNRNRLAGSIGLDNPMENISQLFIQQVSFVGAHLNTARENMRMLAVLEKELHQKDEEQETLRVLCADSTSVFKVNLLEDIAETVKLENGANASEFISAEYRPSFCFSLAMKRYYEEYIIKESISDYLETFSPENLLEELKEKERISRRYQTVPNAIGQQYFEIRASRLDFSKGRYLALVDFRYIDDLVCEEKKHQQELEMTLEETRMKNEIISALGKIYFRIYQIDLIRHYYEEIAGGSSQLHLTGCHGDACVRMAEDSRKQVAPEYRDKVEEFFDLTTIARRLQNEESLAAEYLAADGNWHLARFIVQKRDELGKVVQVLFVIRLISEEKRRERVLMGEAEDARRANEAKSEFLSRMSHDIRTPMNAIMGFTNIAKHHLEDPGKIEDCLNKIQLSGGNLQQLIDDVLDISRIESGEFRLEQKPVNVEEIFELYQQTISGMITEKNLHYKSKKHGILHNVLLTDQLRLSQIYINLLSNAIKYTPENGTVQFELYEEPVDRPGMVRLIAIISDTGIGMSPEFMKNMYQEFSRAVDTRVNKVRGSGLGLAIVKKIVDMMGGTIEAESELQKGTTFRVMLELPYEGECAEASQTKVTARGKQLPDREIHLLVAEDNDLNYEILVEQLAMYNFSCVRAVNGMECVQKFGESAIGEYDGILMDMQMPVMNGLIATRKIRALGHPEAKTIPIIALTANAYENDVRKCLEAGMNAHLAKPIQVEQVIAELAHYIGVSAE